MHLPHHLLEKQPASYSKKKEYTFHKLLGCGTFGQVKQATWKHSVNGKEPETREVAVKCIEKRLVKSKPEIVYDEMDVLRGLDNPHIVKILDWFESKDKFYLVFEHIQGGELFEQIVKRHHFTEHDAATCIEAILEGVQYLHHKDLCHRDLKPENLLLRDRASGHLSEIVIADFGVAKHLEADGETLKTLVGSPGYSAPELFDTEGYHGREADIWSIGVITYALLSGTTPFSQKDPAVCLAEQRMGEIPFDRAVWQTTSKEAKDFIRQCLKVKYNERPTADDLLQHKWLQQESVRSDKNIGHEVRRTLTKDAAEGGGSVAQSIRALETHEKELESKNSHIEEKIKKLGHKISTIEV